MLLSAHLRLSGSAILAIALLSGACVGRAAVLEKSDVVFMYQAGRDIYEAYGATVLAWGGTPSPASLKNAEGIRFFGSVGMVTEFSRYYERFPERYAEGLCRDIKGQPVKVPWLTDHQHKGIPYWWCCTQQPLFRQYIRERVQETVRAGAAGVHIDDHMGTSGGLWLGVCFCERCVTGFRAFVEALAPDVRAQFGIARPESFDFRTEMAAWLAEKPGGARKPTQHPLWGQWTIYQCRAAAAFMQELRDLAATTAGHTVPMGANAGLLWPRHLADYQSLDLFSAETDHHASQERMTDLPIFAYRLADAVGRPYAATASGGDWAFIAEHERPGLVLGWIAMSYAAGHCFMAPHHQWCYTPQKGTHWYNGPRETFAPLYRFVRENKAWLDQCETDVDVGVVLPHRSFVANPQRWFDLAGQLAARNLSYSLILGGDEIVDCAIRPESLRGPRALLVPDPKALLPRDQETLNKAGAGLRLYALADDLLANVRPAVQVSGSASVRTLARVKRGQTVIHILNYDYDRAQGAFTPTRGLQLEIDREALAIPASAQCTFVQLGQAEQPLSLMGNKVEVPSVKVWGLVRLTSGAP